MSQVSRSQVSLATRSLAVLGLAAVTLGAIATDASAFPGRPFGAAPGFSGGGHALGRSPGAGPFGGGGVHPSFGIRPLPIAVRPPRQPGGQPPIVHPPRIPIGHWPHPWPHPIWPPIYIHHHPHHWPIIPVGGAVLVPAAVGAAAVAAPVGPSCGISGTFVSVVFLPTATVAEVNAFLKSYDVTVADGPNLDGVYKIRLSDGLLPANRIVEVVNSMRARAAIVAEVRS